jgi:hypothetical protein
MGVMTAASSDARPSVGLERGTIAPAIVVLALAVVMSVILPKLDSETTYRNQIQEGDIAEVADGITLVPAPGWDLASGALVGKTRSAIDGTATSEFVYGSVTFFVRAAPFAGTPSALLTRINTIDAHLHHARGRDAGTTDRYSVRTRQGDVGVAENFVGVARQGSVVAFVLDVPGRPSASQRGPAHEGLEIVAAGPTDELARQRDDITSMIRSIRRAP